MAAFLRTELMPVPAPARPSQLRASRRGERAHLLDPTGSSARVNWKKPPDRDIRAEAPTRVQHSRYYAPFRAARPVFSRSFPHGPLVTCLPEAPDGSAKPQSTGAPQKNSPDRCVSPRASKCGMALQGEAFAP